MVEEYGQLNFHFGKYVEAFFFIEIQLIYNFVLVSGV